jgi:hypothetical protein
LLREDNMAIVTPIPFPAIQGVRTDHSSFQMHIDGSASAPGGNLWIYGLKSWDWKSGLEPGELRGAAAQAVGWTRGQYKGDGNLELWRADADNFEAMLTNNHPGQGLYELWFLLQGYCYESSLPLPSSIQAWARIKERSSESKNTNEPHSKKYPLIYAAVMENGIIETSGLVFPGMQTI